MLKMRFIRNEIMRYQVVHTKLEERGINSPFHLFRNCSKNVSILRFFLIFVRMVCTFKFLSRELSAVLIIQEILIVLKNDFCDIERWKHISILQIPPGGRVLKNPRKLLSYSSIFSL
jgi:hypothetical protein